MSQPTRDYKAAEQDLKDITQMNYGLLDSYEAVFNPANKNSKESIFEIQYIEDGSNAGVHNDIPWRLIPK